MYRSADPSPGASSTPARWRRVGLAVAVLLGLAVPPASWASAPTPGASLPAEVPVPSPLPTAADSYPSWQLQDRNQPLQDRSFPLVPVVGDRAGMAVRSGDAKRSTWRLDANLLFGRDSDELRPAARRRIADLAKELRAVAPSAVTITGFTDDLGSAEHGLDLSQRRAKAVQRKLGDSLTRHRVTVLGKGEAEPEVPNDSEQHRARNRRVVVTVVPR